jgi:hypothetical protein
MTREGVAMLLAQMLDYDATVTSAEIIEHDDGTLEAEVHQVPGIEAGIASKPVIKQLREAGDGDPDTPTVLRLRFPPSREVLVRADAVPGYGWQAWAPAADLPVTPVRVEGTTLDNGELRVEVDAADGTFSVNGVAGMGRLVDGGDNGDTYNYNPPAGDRLVEAPEQVEVSTVEQGPLRARMLIVATYRWPEVTLGEDRLGDREVVVRTTLELCAGERVLRVGVEFDNTVRDHRLRAHFPLPEPAAVSHAECSFTVVERGLTAEGGATEYGLPTFPSRRFVSAGGLTVLHEGLLEYELVDIAGTGDDARARELALTLVRSTGMLSRPPMRYRPMPAGPFHQLEGAQLQGPVSLRYALAVSDDDPYDLVDEAFLPLTTVDATGAGEGPAEGSALEIRGGQVSAVRRQGGALTVRVFNPTDEPTVVEVPGRRGWLVDLRGRPVHPFEGSFPLGAQTIATAQLSD